MAEGGGGGRQWSATLFLSAIVLQSVLKKNIKNIHSSVHFSTEKRFEKNHQKYPEVPSASVLKSVLTKNFRNFKRRKVRKRGLKLTTPSIVLVKFQCFSRFGS